MVALGHGGGQKIVICYTFFTAMYVFGVCLLDVVNILINDERGDLDVSGVYTTLPPVNMDSNEDFASKDEGETIDSLTGRQLRSGAEIALTDGQNLEELQILRQY